MMRCDEAVPLKLASKLSRTPSLALSATPSTGRTITGRQRAAGQARIRITCTAGGAWRA